MESIKWIEIDEDHGAYFSDVTYSTIKNEGFTEKCFPNGQPANEVVVVCFPRPDLPKPITVRVAKFDTDHWWCSITETDGHDKNVEKLVNSLGETDIILSFNRNVYLLHQIVSSPARVV